MNKLSARFFTQDVDTVAKNLLGKVLYWYNHTVIICETESYDEADSASHSYLGKRTPRNLPMFGHPGAIYVYCIYGIHFCVNIVTGKYNQGEAVLIRAIYDLNKKVYINGPGRVCNYLQINKNHNNLSLIDDQNIFISDANYHYNYIINSRIGITKNTEVLRRFTIEKKNFKNN